MPTIVYRNAIALINGADISVAIHDLSMSYNADMLDKTTMGNDTHIKTGGLFTGNMSAKGFVDPVAALNLDGVVFNDIGPGVASAPNVGWQSGAAVEDQIIALFPDGIIEGSTTSGMGYAMKAVLSSFKLGGNVGTLLDLEMAAESRGIAQ